MDTLRDGDDDTIVAFGLRCRGEETLILCICQKFKPRKVQSALQANRSGMRMYQRRDDLHQGEKADEGHAGEAKHGGILVDTLVQGNAAFPSERRVEVSCRREDLLK